VIDRIKCTLSAFQSVERSADDHGQIGGRVVNVLDLYYRYQ
jgi:hypothetical protein